MSSSTPFAGCVAAARLAVVAAVLALAACSQQLPPRSPSALMSDPAVLQGVLFRCNQLQNAALRDAECRNAREAVDRLAAAESAMDDGKPAVDEGFEKAREARRARDERERQRQEAQPNDQVDPYTMPLVPEQTTAPLATIVVSAASLPGER